MNVPYPYHWLHFGSNTLRKFYNYRALCFYAGHFYIINNEIIGPIGFAGHSNWMMTRWPLLHPKPVPKTRTPPTGESLGRCNRTNMISKGHHWLRCVWSETDWTTQDQMERQLRADPMAKGQVSFCVISQTWAYALFGMTCCLFFYWFCWFFSF